MRVYFVALSATVWMLGTVACGSDSHVALTSGKSVVGHGAGAGHGPPVRRWHLVAGRRVAFGDYDVDELQGGRIDHDDDDLPGPLDSDGDRDGGNGTYLDADDRGAGIPDQPADSHDDRVIQVLVRRYFAAALSADGRKACALMLPALARSLPRDPGVLSYAQAKTCPAIMSKMLKANRQQLTVEAGALEAVHARVQGNRGWVLLTFRGIATRGLAIQRYAHMWKMSVTILDQDLP